MNGHRFLKDAIKRLEAYRLQGEQAMAQLSDTGFDWKYNEVSNSIAIIVKHMSGNMISRWTDFLTTDGEKPNRDRDSEFEADVAGRETLMQRWNEGWDTLLATLRSLEPDDLEKDIRIRGEVHNVADAIIRQLMHYASHVGQIIFIAKMIRGNEWKTLSIPKGGSEEFNKKMTGSS